MAIDQAVADVLDETIQALTLLDSCRRSVVAFGEVDLHPRTLGIFAAAEDSIDLILAKKRLLKLILQNFEANLKALNRLHGRNTSDQWAH